jgi:hypothetical protein
MSRQRLPQRNYLPTLLHDRGILTASQIKEILPVTQPTISNWLRALGKEIVRIGRGRATRYALRRQVRQCGKEWAILHMDEAGCLGFWATLHALHGGFWLEIERPPAWLTRVYREGFFPSLPFFLNDLRPQGFLGRAVAKELSKHAALPPDPRVWNDDDVLDFLLHHGSDLPGNLIISSDRVSSPAVLPPWPEANRSNEYVRCADQAMRGELPGSSAGGEQPKFVGRIKSADNTIRDVLVKFSPPRTTSIGQRWADLLAAEEHALRVLKECGLPSADVQAIDAGDRRFLEVRRFDRNSLGGRKGMISLQALVSGLSEADLSQNWVSASETLLAEEWIDSTTATQINLAWCFGRLIGNTDMHGGNLSFWFGDDLPFRLTPIYDMLPMAYAPVHGELRSVNLDPLPLSRSLIPVRLQALRYAIQFWHNVKDDDRVSPEFRQEAAQNGSRLLRN